MSGAFEVAAGAFAVIGVADVIIRTGRELCTFLRDVTDAPSEIKDLHDLIQVTLTLTNTSKRCLVDLKTHSAPITVDTAIPSLESSIVALSRALQNLKRLVSKFKGTRTWSRVKFVLDASKVQKATASLERAKTSLTSSLVLASQKFTQLGNARIENVIRDGFRTAGLQITDLTQVLTTKMDTQHKEVLEAYRNERRAVISKLDNQETVQLGYHDKQHQALSTIQRSQTTMLASQRSANRSAARMRKDTSAIRQAIRQTDENVVNTSMKTIKMLDDIEAGMKQLLSSHGTITKRVPSGRHISFYGESPRKILQYLLSFEDRVNYAIDYLVSQHGEDISKGHAELLRTEFQNMVNSATQEKAAQHPGSMATSIDEWSYPQDTKGIMKASPRKLNSVRQAAESILAARSDSNPCTQKMLKSSKWPMKQWTVTTAGGEVQISLPWRRITRRDHWMTEEVGLSHTITQDCLSVRIHARFLREMSYKAQSRIHAQLNMSVLVKDLTAYISLFEDATVVEIDQALRSGKVSLFHADAKGGNLCLLMSVFFARLDILEYLETRGVSQHILGNDAVFWGLNAVFFRQERGNDRREEILMRALRVSPNPVEFALQMALTWLLDPCYAMRSSPPWKQLFLLLELLRDEWFDSEQNESLRECCSLETSRLFHDKVPDLLILLIDAGATVAGEPRYYFNSIAQFFAHNCTLHYSYEVSVGILDILIKHVRDVHQANWYGVTPSMLARAMNMQWDVWCDALKQNQMDVNEVVQTEGTTWLLSNDWHEWWVKHRYGLWDLVEANDKRIHDNVSEDEEAQAQQCEGHKLGQKEYKRHRSLIQAFKQAGDLTSFGT